MDDRVVGQCSGWRRHDCTAFLDEPSPQPALQSAWVKSGAPSRGEFWRVEGFTEMTQQALNVVSFDDERAQFETAGTLIAGRQSVWLTVNRSHRHDPADRCSRANTGGCALSTPRVVRGTPKHCTNASG